MNLLATTALLGIAIAQLIMASASLWPTPQEVHFKAVQEFCKELTIKKTPADYFACMASLRK
jgi:hypothetical protein